MKQKFYVLAGLPVGRILTATNHLHTSDAIVTSTFNAVKKGRGNREALKKKTVINWFLQKSMELLTNRNDSTG